MDDLENNFVNLEQCTIKNKDLGNEWRNIKRKSKIME